MYLSIILGITFLTLRFIGLFLDLTHNDLYLALGLLFLIGIALPLYLVNRERYKRKVRDIMEEYKQKGPGLKDPKSKEGSEKEVSGKEKLREYPSFRHQKQGIKWTGGSVHGASATRGAKRSFLKK